MRPLALEHDAIRRNRLIVEWCSRFKTLERVRTAKPIPLFNERALVRIERFVEDAANDQPMRISFGLYARRISGGLPLVVCAPADRRQRDALRGAMMLCSNRSKTPVIEIFSGDAARRSTLAARLTLGTSMAKKPARKTAAKAKPAAKKKAAAKKPAKKK
jgi:hypothetical protein